MNRHRFLLLLSLIVFTPGSPALRAEESWPQFRGPLGTGHSREADVPTTWDADDVIWKTELRGTGQSSPVSWGDKLFLTGSSEDGGERYVFCVDRTKGGILWEKTIECAKEEQTHKMNSLATPTCATDGERVVAFFGPAGIHCFDLDGGELWSKDLGDFPGVWGTAASPILVGEKVIQNCDATGPSRLLALDRKTGEVIWDTRREDKPHGGWSTPILIEYAGKRELVLNGEFGVRGYDPESGRELWFCKGFNGRGAPVPDFAGGTLFVVNGKPGDVYAVEPGGEGDVTATRMKWHTGKQSGRDLPSPAVVDGYVIVVNMKGVGACFDAKSGELLWNEKLPLSGEYSASPMVANGLVYLQVVYGGETIVIKPGPKLEVVAQNAIGADPDEIFRATLAPIRGQLFARSRSLLYCIDPK